MQIVELTNLERAKAGLPPLEADERLMTAAQLHADQMAQLSLFDHVLPNAPYPSPTDRLAAAGYQWQAWAENIAFGMPTPSAAVEGWMESSGHRENLLNTQLTELGAAFATGAEGRTYFAQVFGLPN